LNIKTSQYFLDLVKNIDENEAAGGNLFYTINALFLPIFKAGAKEATTEVFLESFAEGKE
jgi:hypothetical protein